MLTTVSSLMGSDNMKVRIRKHTPTVSQTMPRPHLAITTKCFYRAYQTDFQTRTSTATSVLIIIPDGYPNAGDVAILRKAHYGTKQGGRQFYDKIAKGLLDIGLIQCPNEPCLVRFFMRSNPAPYFVCFLILHVDDGGHTRRLSSQLGAKPYPLSNFVQR